MTAFLLKPFYLLFFMLLLTSCVASTRQEPTLPKVTTSPDIPVTKTVMDEDLMMIGVMSNITGHVKYNPEAMLPEGSYMVIKLLDISKMDAASVLIAEVLIKSPTADMPFKIIYNLNHVEEKFSYSLQANLYDSTGKRLYITKTSNPVLTKGFGRKEIILTLEDISG